jgi:valyl-tRNA synthetase
VLLNTGESVAPIDESRLDIADKWILSRLADTITDVTELIERFELAWQAEVQDSFGTNTATGI